MSGKKKQEKDIGSSIDPEERPDFKITKAQIKNQEILTLVKTVVRCSLVRKN
jgi:hypothetical protein